MGFIRGDMRVMIVEDHLLYTEVIRKIVGEMGHAVVAEATTVSKALACLAVALPELVIVDMELPDGTGFDLMRRDVDPKPRFLVVSAHCDSLTAHLVSHLEVAGYVDKGSCSVRTIKEAIEAVEGGRKYFSPRFMAAYQDALTLKWSFIGRLSPQEHCVLLMLVRGYDDADIGAELGISAATVKTHRGRILRKARCASTRQLMAFALEQGFAFLGKICGRGD